MAQSKEAEIQFILGILEVKERKSKKDSYPPVATITESGVHYYRSHPDERVRKALQAYLVHPRRKPIIEIRISIAA